MANPSNVIESQFSTTLPNDIPTNVLNDIIVGINAEKQVIEMIDVYTVEDIDKLLVITEYALKKLQILFYLKNVEQFRKNAIDEVATKLLQAHDSAVTGLQNMKRPRVE